MQFVNRSGALRVRAGAGRGLLLLAAIAWLIAPGAAFASGEHFDVLLYDDGNGNVKAGGIDVDFLDAELGTVAIEGELFGTVATGFTGDEPGFASYSDANADIFLPGPETNLPANAGILIDFLVEPTLNISLAYWDGAQFGPTPLGETLGLFDGATGFGSIGGTSEVFGVDIGPTSATGFKDDHPDYVFGAGTTPGVYLGYGQANVAGLSGPSNPFWIVFGTLDACELAGPTDPGCTLEQEEFNEAIEAQIDPALAYVNAVLVPEPGTALLFGLGLMGLGRAGRSRS